MKKKPQITPENKAILSAPENKQVQEPKPKRKRKTPNQKNNNSFAALSPGDRRGKP